MRIREGWKGGEGGREREKEGGRKRESEWLHATSLTIQIN